MHLEKGGMGQQYFSDRRGGRGGTKRTSAFFKDLIESLTKRVGFQVGKE